MKKQMKLLALIVIISLTSTGSLACSDHLSTDDSAATIASKKAMETMHHGMMIDYTGDADKDFASGMVPHHQGAVDMAKIELQYGKDPELRKLAEDIIASQNKEILFMNKWLAKHDKAKK